MQDDESQLYSNFVGEYVQVMTNIVVSGHQQIGEDIFECQDTIKLRGRIIDMDNEYVYFGTEKEGVSQALRRDTIVHIAVVEVDDPARDLLEAMPAPTSDEEVN